MFSDFYGRYPFEQGFRRNTSASALTHITELQKGHERKKEDICVGTERWAPGNAADSHTKRIHRDTNGTNRIPDIIINESIHYTALRNGRIWN